MNGRHFVKLLLPWLLCGGGLARGIDISRFVFPGQSAALQTLTSTAEPSTLQQPTGDLLEFEDGSLMHGSLKRMDITNGLSWADPSARAPIDLQPVHIGSIRFASPNAVSLNPTARVHFANGDDLFGNVTSLDNNRLVFSTWFAGALTIPRSFVQTITVLSSNYAMVYDGPDDASGWVVGNHNPESWNYRDGAFVASSPGTLGRDFKLTGSSTIEFDLSWNEGFQVLVSIYSDTVDHLDMGNCYVLEFTREEVNLRRLDAGRRFPFRNFGSAPMPFADNKNKYHIAIQSNKEEGTVAVFVDDVLVRRWRDENGFSGTGTGLLFQNDGISGAMLRLSNFKISQWRGLYEPESSAVATNTDVIHFINHDHAAGKITSINGGMLSLDFGGTPLHIPLERVTQINFASAPVAAATHGPWEVRAHFPRGGTLSFQLEKWNDREVFGHSSIFGALALHPGQIRQLEFNLDHPRLLVPAVSDREFEGLDE